MADVLISATALRGELARFKKRIDDDEAWRGPDDSGVKVGRALLAGFEVAIERASERYVSTSAAARATGWNAQTLQAYARKVLEAQKADRSKAAELWEAIPQEWRSLRVQGLPYAFVVSSLPVKGRE